MDEVLEKFLEDQKSKIAEEKACLEQEPPYMEMRGTLLGQKHDCCGFPPSVLYLTVL
uniref:Uncharacterized protein n=1 Tax=Sinocyclocheilus grahami TaxID=75366 RepID=A0A672NTM7_SINGR